MVIEQVNMNKNERLKHMITTAKIRGVLKLNHEICMLAVVWADKIRKKAIGGN